MAATPKATPASKALAIRKQRIAELVLIVQREADALFTIDPQYVNWGHVGDAGRIIDLLEVAAGVKS